MQQTEQQHPEIWAEFMKGNFCVTKGVAGFTSIGPDHGIEQENRELKVIGGIVGITQNEKSLDKYFLIAPELIFGLVITNCVGSVMVCKIID